MPKRKNSEFDYVASNVKLSGSAPSPEGREQMEHGELVYFLARGFVNEVSFPEDKDGNINRVAKVKLEQGFVVSAEDAENIIAEQREKQSGQGNIIAEINRQKAKEPEAEAEAPKDDPKIKKLKPKAKKAAKAKPEPEPVKDEEDDDDEFDVDLDIG